MSIFNLNKSLGPCFVRALYYVALVLIALGLLRGLADGVRMMNGPQPAAMATAPVPPGSTQTAAAPPPPRTPPVVGGERRFPGFGPPGPRFRGRPFARPGFVIGGPLLRGMPPPVLGAARIVGALFVAAVLVMLVRVLAEIAGAILAMGAKARAQP